MVDDDYYEIGDDGDYSEPIGSCDECGTNLYDDDVWVFFGEDLCGQCYWHATGGGLT